MIVLLCSFFFIFIDSIYSFQFLQAKIGCLATQLVDKHWNITLKTFCMFIRFLYSLFSRGVLARRKCGSTICSPEQQSDIWVPECEGNLKMIQLHIIHCPHCNYTKLVENQQSFQSKVEMLIKTVWFKPVGNIFSWKKRYTVNKHLTKAWQVAKGIFFSPADAQWPLL